MEAIEALSEGLAAAVESAGRSVVRIEARRRGGASGVVVRPDVIVAADHSVDVDEMAIGWPDGTAGRARVVGRDPSTDLVVLKTEAGRGQPIAWDNEARIRPGNVVVAALRPGRSVRAAVGSVNAVGNEWRTPAGGRIDRYVQLDISRQPGLSGAAVATASGKVTGIATTGLLRATVMLVPAATVGRVAETLLAHGHVRRGYLGIGTIPVRVPAAEGNDSKGLLVTFVQPGAPAAQAGLLLGDVILTADGKPLSSPGDLMPLLDAERIDVEVGFAVLRAAERVDLRIRIGATTAGTAR